jgi:hypothetical protein
MRQRKGISSGMGPHRALAPGPTARRLLPWGSGAVTHWSVEVDQQLLCSGMARRPAVTPLPQHLLRASDIAHQHHHERQHQLHRHGRQHFNCWAL